MTNKPLGRPTDPQARAKRRQQIVDGARKCFVQKGFHNSGMALIGATAHVSIANIYQYFATKDDLIIALVEEELQNDLAIIRMVAAAPTLREGLKIAIAQLSGTDLQGAVQLRLEVLAESFRNPVVAAVVKKGEAMTIAALAASLTHAQVRGEIAETVVPDEAAALILAFSDGLLSRLTIGPKPMDELAKPAFSFVANTLGMSPD